jgi:hypothetical protein
MWPTNNEEREQRTAAARSHSSASLTRARERALDNAGSSPMNGSARLGSAKVSGTASRIVWLSCVYKVSRLFAVPRRGDKDIYSNNTKAAFYNADVIFAYVAVDGTRNRIARG